MHQTQCPWHVSNFYQLKHISMLVVPQMRQLTGHIELRHRCIPLVYVFHVVGGWQVDEQGLHDLRVQKIQSPEVETILSCSLIQQQHAVQP
jgi:hypothetical protein